MLLVWFYAKRRLPRDLYFVLTPLFLHHASFEPHRTHTVLLDPVGPCAVVALARASMLVLLTLLDAVKIIHAALMLVAAGFEALTYM